MPEPSNLYNYLTRSAENHPRKIWISEGARRVSYVDGLALVDAMSRRLAGLGVSTGDRVALCMPNVMAYPILAFACWQIGGVVVGLNPLYGPTMLKRQIEDSGASIVASIDDDELSQKLEEALASSDAVQRLIMRKDGNDLFEKAPASRPGWRGYDSAAVDKPEAPAGTALRNVNDLALLQYTGGTTGTPKGAMLTHKNVSSCVEQLRSGMPSLQDGKEKFIALGPFAHIIGTTLVLATATAIAGEIAISERFHPEKTTRFCLDNKISVIFAVPTAFAAMANSAAAKDGDWSALSAAMCGGSALPGEIAAAFKTVTGHKLMQGYGLSETASGCAFTKNGAVYPTGSVGEALPCSRVEIRDAETDILAKEGEIGEICVAGPQVMEGYWQRPDATEEAMKGELFRTGDTGYVQDGALFIVDRLKDIIIASGYNIYPRLVEEMIYMHPAVVEAAVIGVPDEYRGETVKAVVALAKDTSLSLKDLQEFLQPKLSPIEIPKLLEVRSELPKTAVGKIAKIELR